MLPKHQSAKILEKLFFFSKKCAMPFLLLSGKCNRMGEIKSFSRTQYTPKLLFRMHVEHSAFFSEVYLLTYEEVLLLSWLRNSSKTFFSVFTITLLQSLPHEFERVFLFPGGSEASLSNQFYFSLTSEWCRRGSEA